MTILVIPGDHSAGSIHAVLKLWLSKGSFRPPAVKVKPCGFLAKTFLFYLRSSAVKNFLPETLTLPLALVESVSKP